MAELNPNIILAGQPLNLLGIMDQTNRMAGETLDRRHQQDYRNMLATNGAGIVAGEQNALNALAGYDPQAALTVQDTRLGMDAQRQRMSILSAQEARAAASYAAGLSADQRAAEAAQIEDAVKMGMMIPDAATWDKTMATMAPDLVGQFDNRAMFAAKYMGMADVLKMATPEPVDPLKGAPSGYMWSQPGNPAAGVAPIPGMPVEAPALPYDVPPGYMPADPSNPLAGVVPIPGYEAKPQAPYTPEGKLKADLQAGRITEAEFTSGMARLAPKGTTITMNPATGEMVYTQGAAVGGTGPTVGDVYNPNEIASVVGLIDQIAEDPNLKNVVGYKASFLGGGNQVSDFSMAQRLGYGPGGVSTIEKIGQLQSNAWLSARQMLKGGGAITDYESKKAEAAVARLERPKSEEDFRAALQELRDAIVEGEKKMRGGPDWIPAGDMAVPEGIDPADWEYMTPEERAMFK